MVKFLDNFTVNVYIQSFGFFFINFAFYTQGLIEETVINSYAQHGNIDKHAGYTSQAVNYATLTIANCVAAALVGTLRIRWSLFVGTLTFVIFECGFLFLNEYVLYSTSALLGVGSAILWCAHGKYLALISTKATAARNSAIFFTIYQSGTIFGGIFLLLMFKYADKTDNFDIPLIHILYAVFAGVSFCGLMILSTLPMPKSEGFTIDGIETKMPQMAIMKSTLSLLSDKKILLISVTMLYTGMSLTFWSGIYPTCVAFTKKLNGDSNILLAVTVIMAGVGETLGGVICGVIGYFYKNIRRRVIVTAVTVCNLLVIAVIFINFPKESALDETHELGFITPSTTIAITCGFWLGFNDVIIKVEKHSLF
uniref:UNC93-like protein MFSD11 n=1 Tax=Acrobeloides nanus TaxID=290746 RepID=A0A914DC70_9BILA